MSSGGFTVPKGYRYNPSDEELFSDLEQKNHSKDSQITTIIPEIDVCKYEPRQLPELAFTRAENLAGKFFFFFFFWIIREESWHSQRKWYFFTRLDYMNTGSSRVNRTTGEGFWKITGKDRAIKDPDSKAVIGRKRTLTFYKRGVSKAQKAQKTGWVIHEYFLIQESCDPPKQIGEYVVCCLKYKSDNSDHDKDAPFCNRGSRSCSMATNVENQADPCCMEQNDHSTSVEDQPDMIEELLDDPENLDLLFHPPAPPQLDQLHQSPMSTTDVHKHECRKRAYPFEHDDPSLPKKNNISTDDGNKLVSNSASDSENQAANVNPERYSHPGANLRSAFGLFLPKDYVCTQPSINGGPRYFSNDNNFIELNDLQSSCKGIDSSLASTDDDDKLVSNSASNSESQAANVIPEGYSQPGANLGSDFDLFLPKDYVCTQPSINGGPRHFSNDNNFIQWDDFLAFYEDTLVNAYGLNAIRRSTLLPFSECAPRRIQLQSSITSQVYRSVKLQRHYIAVYLPQ
ncbi:hypothetical protein ACLB2K_076478 [Fragaria x ananassa]